MYQSVAIIAASIQRRYEINIYDKNVQYCYFFSVYQRKDKKAGFHNKRIIF